MRTRELAAAAIFAAVTFVVTRYTVIPIPATKGYFNLGEVAIYIAAIAFGPGVGAVAGALGSALADVAAAAPQFALFTFIIKGVEGFIVGRLAGSTAGANVRATISGGACMVVGYFAVETLFARFLGIAPTPAAAVGAALAELPFNIVQVAAGVVVAALVAVRLRGTVREQAPR